VANNLAYENLRVDSVAIGPTAATVLAKGGAASAIFYLDPKASSVVRWRSDGTAPTATTGLPLYPGGQFALAGVMNIRRAKFVSESGAMAELHAAYFDRVDVLAIQFSPQGSRETVDGLAKITARLETMLFLLRQIRNATGKTAFELIGDQVPAGDQ